MRARSPYAGGVRARFLDAFFGGLALPASNPRLQWTRMRAPLSRQPLGAIRPRYVAAWVLVTAFALPAAVKPCSCLGGDEPVDQLLKRSTAVFWGRVVEILPDPNPIASLDSPAGTRTRDRVRFDVGTSWKEIKNADIWVREGNQPTACGFPFHEGGVYLVFADTDTDGELVVWQCSGTHEWPTCGTLDQLTRVTRPRRFAGHPKGLKGNVCA
jgi:hypothetical protein